MMTVDDDLDIRRREAAAWFSRLSQRRVSTEDVRAFSAWRRDPDNARAYERVEAVWESSRDLAADPDISALTTEAMARARPEPARGASIGRLKPFAGLAAALIVVAAAGLWMASRPLVYATEVGEQRTVRLGDGSRVTLGPDSRVQIRLGDDRRSVTLARGQALFDVEGDPDRPFVVEAGDARVTALGTRFEVRRVGEGARVVLVEGRVAVRDARLPRSDWTLKPGEQVVTTAARPTVTPVDAARATSWTTGRLLFDGVPVRVAVAEVNRYSPRKIELRAPAIADIAVSGAFDTGDVDGFVAALEDLYPVTAKPGPDGQVVLSDAPATK
ncbi:MAG: FecR family protein [Brevundimonas sp.]